MQSVSACCSFYTWIYDVQVCKLTIPRLNSRQDYPLLSADGHTSSSLRNFARAVVKAPKSCHITPVLRSLHWLKINERIEYKLLSPTYKVLTTNQPPYLHHLISLQPPRSTRSSSLVTLARPPTSSSLRITDRSFRYASPCLWNQLPSSLRQPHLSPSVSDLSVHAPTTSSHSVNSPLSPSITPSLFHSQLKTYLFH